MRWRLRAGYFGHLIVPHAVCCGVCVRDMKAWCASSGATYRYIRTWSLPPSLCSALFYLTHDVSITQHIFRRINIHKDIITVPVFASHRIIHYQQVGCTASGYICTYAILQFFSQRFSVSVRWGVTKAEFARRTLAAPSRNEYLRVIIKWNSKYFAETEESPPPVIKQ